MKEQNTFPETDADEGLIPDKDKDFRRKNDCQRRGKEIGRKKSKEVKGKELQERGRHCGGRRKEKQKRKIETTSCHCAQLHMAFPLY